MKVLYVPNGTQAAPATRYRVTQYLPHLKEKGIDCRVFSAISEFSTNLTVKSPDFGTAARLLYYCYVFTEKIFRLLAIIIIARGFDIVYFQRTTFSLRMELLLKAVNRNIFFDIDDAIFLPDRQKGDFLYRVKKFIKKNEVINMLKVSKTVVVENEYIKDFVSRYCGNVLKIPGPIDTERFSPGPGHGGGDITIGWIGSPATTLYLAMLEGVFKTLKKKYGFLKFKFIGPGKKALLDTGFERVDWNYDTEVAELRSLDVGIMPMPDNEWTRGKLGCKMLQYMALGIPAVVSFTPTNAEMIINGENGFFVSDEKEWVDILSTLIDSRELRERVGQRARETILERCDLRKNADRLADIFTKG